MFALLKFLLLLVLAAVAIALIAGYSLLRKVMRSVRQFRGQESAQDGGASVERRTSSGGNVIIDRRSPKETNRKIIPDDEGEYVDYEESK